MICCKFPCRIKKQAWGSGGVYLLGSFFPISLSAVFLRPCFQTFPLFCLSKTPTTACLCSKFPGGNTVLSVSSERFPLTFKEKSQELKNHYKGENSKMAGSCFNFLSKASWPGGLAEAGCRADIRNDLQAATQYRALLPTPAICLLPVWLTIDLWLFSLH